ncbi:GNAT family N-acetyltransferase [Streptomyces sp. TRM76323]|uniref:GNAT family N-acetyltransferase n=1 Tax=Streptomyces tamarix TaxID=3078565 RepID=A0ABU3QLU3_9ACTN|nr:GNAT family N-acetyltransferase [Streptomyces tamarix]MDT9683731.1 GNAT family N-acetyltransferase [Streptomyces tamarix]
MVTQATMCCGPRPDDVQIDVKHEPVDVPVEPGGCCGTVTEEPPIVEISSSGCCGDGDTKQETVEIVKATGCCGTTGTDVTVRTGLALSDAAEGVNADRGTWPFLHPAWLRGTETALPDAKPWHAVARSGEDNVLLPGFVFDAPSIVDTDPRTYLGWESATGESACCSVTTSCCSATTDVEAIGEDKFFPSLLLGSPIGYRSEAVGSTNNALLLADLVDQVVPAARAAGIRSIVAPWVADLPANEALLVALQAHGATVSFWGEDNVLTLEHDSYEAHFAAMKARKRRKLQDDHAKALASGAQLVRKDGADLLPIANRIAELVGLNRQKYDGSEGTEQIEALLTSMIESGADVRAYLAYYEGEIVGSTVGFRQGKRLFIKWAGFDYDAIGERSGLYFELLFDRPLKDAYDEKLEALELGPGADQAKRLRGCKPRAVHTALLITDAKVAPKAAELQSAFGEARREALGAETAENSVTGKLLSVFRGGSKLEPIKPIQPEGGCCG